MKKNNQEKTSFISACFVITLIVLSFSLPVLAATDIGIRVQQPINSIHENLFYGNAMGETDGYLIKIEQDTDNYKDLFTVDASGNTYMNGDLDLSSGQNINIDREYAYGDFSIWEDMDDWGTWVLDVDPDDRLKFTGISYFVNNVGINTATPFYDLDINGHARISNNLRINNNIIIDNVVGIGMTAPDERLVIQDRNSWTPLKIHPQDNGAAVGGMAIVAENGNRVEYAARNDGGFRILSTEASGNVLRSDASGNIRIPRGHLELSIGEAYKPGGGSWADSSDKRLKKDIEKIDSAEALEKIISLKGSRFRWKNPEEHGNEAGIRASVIAQDMEKVFPDWVGEKEPSGNDKELFSDGEKQKTVHFPNDFNAYLIEAIKELEKKNKTLEKRISDLENIIAQ